MQRRKHTYDKRFYISVVIACFSVFLPSSVFGLDYCASYTDNDARSLIRKTISENRIESINKIVADARILATVNISSLSQNNKKCIERYLSSAAILFKKLALYKRIYSDFDQGNITDATFKEINNYLLNIYNYYTNHEGDHSKAATKSILKDFNQLLNNNSLFRIDVNYKPNDNIIYWDVLFSEHTVKITHMFFNNETGFIDSKTQEFSTNGSNIRFDAFTNNNDILDNIGSDGLEYNISYRSGPTIQVVSQNTPFLKIKLFVGSGINAYILSNYIEPMLLLVKSEPDSIPLVQTQAMEIKCVEVAHSFRTDPIRPTENERINRVEGKNTLDVGDRFIIIDEIPQNGYINVSLLDGDSPSGYSGWILERGAVQCLN